MILVTRSRPLCRSKLRIMNDDATVTSRKITLTDGLVIMGTNPREAVVPLRKRTK